MSERGPAGQWYHFAYWNGDRMDLEATRDLLPVNDSHAGELLMSEFPGCIWYVPRDDAWRLWDGTCHRLDERSGIAKIIEDFARRLHQVLAHASEQVRARVRAALDAGATVAQARQANATAWQPWEKAEKYAAGLMRKAGKSALAGYMSFGMAGISHEAFSEIRDEELNVPQGMLNLRTGEIRPHSPDDMVTYCLRTRWNPDATAPEFWGMVQRSTADYASACFLMEVLGYCLLGYNPDQVIIYLKGPTGSGKSQLLRIVSAVLEDLAHESQAQLITYTPHGRNARTENSIRGARMITITETSDRMHLDEGQVKRLTGEAWISVDQHYAKTELKTRVTWTIIVATNTMPTLASFDAAMRRRTIVVPGGPSLREDEMDPQIAERILASEKEGILAMLAAGCQQWFSDGRLLMPESVVRASAEYALSQDTVGLFVSECCERGSGVASYGVPSSFIPAAQAWLGYQQWSQGSPRLGRNEFYDVLGRQAGVSRNETMRRFEGIRWTPEWAYKMS